MTKENFKGFKIFPFVDSDKLYREAAIVSHDVERVEETKDGFIYKSGGRWWDQDGEICGLGYVLD